MPYDQQHLSVDDIVPLDVAAELMAAGLDMNEHDGFVVFDPYFND
jgi:ABC-type nitrate/sulfonate/bicarbonate transport system substrate-binding protein